MRNKDIDEFLNKFYYRIELQRLNWKVQLSVEQMMYSGVKLKLTPFVGMPCTSCAQFIIILYQCNAVHLKCSTGALMCNAYEN